MFFVSNGKAHFQNANEKDLFGSVLNLNNVSSLDDGFYHSSMAEELIKTEKRSTPENARLSVGPMSVDIGLTVILGGPGSGKTFFIKEKLSNSFSIRQWGEPEASMFSMTINHLLRHMNDCVTRIGNRSMVIDSLMPLIISSGDNLGQGGLSKRVLTYLRQLSAINIATGSHMVVVMNPLEEGDVLNSWISYIKAVSTSVCVIKDRKAFLSTRLANSDITKMRAFVDETGQISDLGGAVQRPSSGFEIATTNMVRAPVATGVHLSDDDSTSSPLFDPNKYKKFPVVR